jgi:hypothetical protein
MKIRISFKVLTLIRHILTCGECRKILKALFSGKSVLVIDEETGEYWVEQV